MSVVVLKNQISSPVIFTVVSNTDNNKGIATDVEKKKRHLGNSLECKSEEQNINAYGGLIFFLIFFFTVFPSAFVLKRLFICFCFTSIKKEHNHYYYK